jgi:hypothetical protein
MAFKSYYEILDFEFLNSHQKLKDTSIKLNKEIEQDIVLHELIENTNEALVIFSDNQIKNTYNFTLNYLDDVLKGNFVGKSYFDAEENVISFKETKEDNKSSREICVKLLMYFEAEKDILQKQKDLIEIKYFKNLSFTGSKRLFYSTLLIIILWFVLSPK